MNRPRREVRAVHGVLLLDKPLGLTSNAALQRVKRVFHAAKAGHTGSLDPLATGVLPICLGNATRLAGYLLDADKRYRATVRLGVKTTTGDAEGSPVAHSDPSTLTLAALQAAAARLTGAQTQIPPMYSALKHHGQPLYALARQGLEVERAARDIRIDELRVLTLDAVEFSFEVRCSKGTYVRTLAEDWLAAVGQCGHLVALRRTALGDFDERTLTTLDALEQLPDAAARDALLHPIAALLADWPQVVADAAQAARLEHGQPIRFEGAPAAGRVAVFTAGGQALCLAQVDAEGWVAPSRWLAQATVA
ncbi:MAG: tRNA pseudouridine(55) synthase TruB [Nevskiaceae bacterium]|nr:MAG: tRNA pseudouridine(55) synthase TruB [Nevskiaceae bacterium]TBR73514.1 MAG: tRNA pseudouridine(55) synthase TruB [Nevskiaceae bacterium]